MLQLSTKFNAKPNILNSSILIELGLTRTTKYILSTPPVMMLPLQQGPMMMIMKVIDYVGDKCVSHSLGGIWTLVELSAFLWTCDSKHCQSTCSYSLQQSQAYPWANILSTHTSHGTYLHLCGLNGWSNVGIFCAWIIVCLSFFMAPSSSGTCLKSKILLEGTLSEYRKILHKLLLRPMEYFVR